MATKESRLAEIFEYQKRQGRGTVGALGSALGGRALEKLDIRNLLFGQVGTPSKSLSRQIGRSIFGAGYSAAPTRRRYGDFDYDNSFSNVKVERLLSSISDNMANMNSKMTILAKNSIQQNRIARDINVIRQNVVLLTKKELGNARTKADMFFMRSKQREQEYERRLAQQSKRDSDSSIKTASGKKGSLLSSVGKGLKGALAIGGLLTLFSNFDKIVGAFGKIGNYINSLWQQSKNLIDTLKNFNFKELIDSIKNFKLDDLSKLINKFIKTLENFNFDKFMESLKNFDFSAWVNSLDKEKIAGWVTTFFSSVVQGLIAAKDLFKDVISKIPNDQLGKIFIGIAGFFWDTMKFVGETVFRGMSSLSAEELGIVAGASAIYGLLFGTGPLGIGLVGVLLEKVFSVVGKMIKGKALASSIAGSLAGSLGGAMGCCCDGASVPDRRKNGRGNRGRGKIGGGSGKIGGGSGKKGGGSGKKGGGSGKKGGGSGKIGGGSGKGIGKGLGRAAGAVGRAAGRVALRAAGPVGVAVTALEAGAFLAEEFEEAAERSKENTQKYQTQRENERLKDDQKFVEGMKRLYPEQTVEDLALAARNLPPAELNMAISQLGQLYNSNQTKEVKSILERNLRDKFDGSFKKRKEKGTIADEARKRRLKKESKKKSANAVAGSGGWRPPQTGATGTRNFSKPAPTAKPTTVAPVNKSELKPGNYQMIAGQIVEPGKPLTEEQKIAIQIRNEMRGGSATTPSTPPPKTESYLNEESSMPKSNVIRMQNNPGGLPSNFDYNTFTKRVGFFESKNDYGIVNTLGYVGRYQFGAQALETLGYLKRGSYAKGKNASMNDPSNWNNGLSLEKFLNSPEIQDEAMAKLTAMNYKDLKSKGLVNENMSPDELAGMLYVAHGVGVGGAMKFAKGEHVAEGYGTTANQMFARASGKQYAGEDMTKYTISSGGLAAMNRLSSGMPKISGDMFNLPSSDKLGEMGNAIVNVINNNMQKAEQATSEALSSLDMDSVKDMFNPMIARATYGFTI